MLVAEEQINIAVNEARVLSPWTRVLCPADPIDGEVELEWLDLALNGQSTAAIWVGKQGLVAPMSYQRHANLTAACADSAARGWPVRLRRSGGGVVPQGPGILNLSLAKPSTGTPGDLAESVYAELCNLLAGVLSDLGINAGVQAVSGSFCDGRFNLAVTSSQDETPRKIAGTAQYWRHARERHAVLAHALLMVDAEPAMLTAETNRFETALGSGKLYDRNALTSVSQAWSHAHPGRAVPSGLSTELRKLIVARLNHQCLTGDLDVTA